MENKVFEVNFNSLFKKYKYKVFIISFCVSVIFVAVGYFLPREYQADFKLFPAKDLGGASGILNLLPSSAAGLNLPGLSKSNQTILVSEILQSRTLAEELLKMNEYKELREKPELKDYEKIVKLQKAITVELEKTGFITFSISYGTKAFPNRQDKDSAKVKVARIANRAIEIADDLLKKKNNNSSGRMRQYLEGELNMYYTRLDTISRNLEHFQSNNKVLSLDDQTEAIVQQAITLGTELTKAETDLNLARIQYDANSPALKAIEKQVAFLRAQINKVQKGTFFDKDDFSIPLDKVPGLTREYVNLIRSKKILEQVVLYLETQKHQEAIQENQNTPTIDVLDRALVPAGPVSPNLPMIGIVSFLITSILSALYFSYKDFRLPSPVISKES